MTHVASARAAPTSAIARRWRCSAGGSSQMQGSFPTGRYPKSSKTAALDVERSSAAPPAVEGLAESGKAHSVAEFFLPVDEVCSEAVSKGIEVVEGRVPSSLRGLFIRNGPNAGRRASDGEDHAWDGDGMLHAVWFGDNGDEVEIRYKNRYVETIGRSMEELLALDSGEPLFDGMKFTRDGTARTIALSLAKWSLPSWMFGLRQDAGVRGDTDLMVMKKNVANTALVFHHDKLLALWEAGFPYEVDVRTLETKGADSLQGSLNLSMSAHPKINPANGEMIDVTYDLLRWPHCFVRVWNREGKLLHKTSVDDVQDPIMIHDSAITKNYTLILDLPLGLDFNMDILNPQNWLSIGFNADKRARVGLLPRFGCNRDIKWFEVSPCWIFHTINAYEENDKVVLHVIRNTSTSSVSDLISGTETSSSEPYEYVFDLTTGRTHEKSVPCSPMFFELPQINPNFLGKKAQYGFASGKAKRVPGFTCCTKLDLQRDDYNPQTYTLPEGCVAGEFVFTPREESEQYSPSGDGSDNGWLISYVYNGVSGKSEVHVVDARTMRLACRIALPFRVPDGIHGIFIPKNALPNNYFLV